MMLSALRLRRKPRLLHSLSGLTVVQFIELTNRIEPLWQKEEITRLTHLERERAIGAGHPYHLQTMDDKLLLLLVSWRHALTHELLGCLFHMDQSNVTRLIHRLSPLIEPAADPMLKTFLREAQRQRRKIGSLEEFLKMVPELKEILGDTTEQQRQRPKNKRAQKRYYSGKKKRHTFKTEIIVTPAGKILHISATYPGPIPDAKIHEEEHLPWLIPKETKQYYDRGFRALCRDHPEQDIRVPHQRSSPGRNGRGKKGRPLTRGQKQANTLRAKRRIPVEHVFARAKKFRILSALWRSRDECYNRTFRGVAALCNFRLTYATR